MGCARFNVCVVNDFDAFLTTLGSPMDILAGFDRQAAQAAGVKPTTYIEWEKAHETYFGTTRSTRKQAHAVRTVSYTHLRAHETTE